MSGSELLLTLLGAVALLLWGVRMVRTGMMRAFGATLRSVLTSASRNRLTAFFGGLGVTGILQSATATTLLLSSFAGRGLVTLPIALAMILGADLGSTIVAQIFAFDIKWLWAVGAVIGLVLFSAASDERLRSIGRIAIGLALMLLALKVLGDVGGALRGSGTVRQVLSALSSEPLIAVLIAALLTWLAHSSLAIVLLVMSLAGSGAIEPRLALALVLGANIGGTLAPLGALAGAPVAAQRVPIGNLIARGAVALVLIPFLGVFLAPLEAVSFGPERLVLNAHTAFNLLVAVIFLPLVGPLAQLVTRLRPAPAVTADPMIPQHLDPSALETPLEALGCAMRETLHVGDIVLDMLRRSLGAIEGSDMRIIKELEKADDVVDSLHEAIKLYLIRASKADLSEAEARRYVEIITFNTNLEHIGDIVDKNLMELAAKKIKKRYTFSPEGLAELKRFHAQVMDNMRLALNVFATRDVTLARRLLVEKTSMRSREFDAADRHFARLKEGRSQSIETSAIHLDIIRDLKRINSHLTSVAYPILEAAGELRESRLREEQGAAEAASGSGAADGGAEASTGGASAGAAARSR
jgi:phosphate:Na+ symporter